MKLAACIALLCALFTGLQKANAQDILECVAAGRVAKVVTTAINQGTPIDRVQVGFPKSPPEMEAQNQALVNKVKQVLAMLLQKETMPQPFTQEARDFAVHMGVEVMKQCAFDIGALRRVGSTPPPTEEELMKQLGIDLSNLHRQVQAASSQAMADHDERVARCDEILEDEGYIARLHAAGQSFGDMRQRALNSAPYLGRERLEKIMSLIQEAQNSKDVQAWHQKKRAECEA